MKSAYESWIWTITLIDSVLGGDRTPRGNLFRDRKPVEGAYAAKKPSISNTANVPEKISFGRRCDHCWYVYLDMPEGESELALAAFSLVEEDSVPGGGGFSPWQKERVYQFFSL